MKFHLVMLYSPILGFICTHDLEWLKHEAAVYTTSFECILLHEERAVILSCIYFTAATGYQRATIAVKRL